MVSLSSHFSFVSPKARACSSRAVARIKFRKRLPSVPLGVSSTNPVRFRLLSFPRRRRFFILRASSAEDWPGQLAKLLAKRGGSVLLDAVIDSGGGDIMGQVNKILKPGGKVVVYGMYAFTCTHTPSSSHSFHVNLRLGLPTPL